jgi:hypothetical protein
LAVFLISSPYGYPQVNIELTLLRFFQIILLAIFAFLVVVYFGALLLVPLDLVVQLTKVLMAVGIPAVVAVLASAGGVGYVGHLVWKLGIHTFLINTGMMLFNLGRDSVKELDEIVNSAKTR